MRYLSVVLAAVLSISLASCDFDSTGPKGDDDTGIINLPEGTAAFVVKFIPAKAVDSIRVALPSTGETPYTSFSPLTGRLLVLSPTATELGPRVRFHLYRASGAEISQIKVIEVASEAGVVGDGAGTSVYLDKVY